MTSYMIVIAVLLCATAIPFNSLRQARKCDWWELTLGTSRLQTQNVIQALQPFNGSNRPGSLTIVRLGTAASEPRVWIGVRGISDSENCAQNLARVAGASLGERCRPSTDSLPRNWKRISSARPLYAKNRPRRRKQPPEVTVAAIQNWAGQIDTHTNQHDALVLTVVPSRDSRFVRVMVAATSKDLSKSWLLGGRTVSLYPRCSPYLVTPIAAIIVTILFMRTIEVWGITIGENALGWSPEVALAIVLYSLVWILLEIVRPVTIRMLIRTSCLPVGVLIRNLVGDVRSIEVAGWANVRNVR